MKRMILLAAMICTISHGANVTSSYTKAEMDAVDATVIAQSNTWNLVISNATQSALEGTNTAIQAQFTAQGVTNAAVQTTLDGFDTALEDTNAVHYASAIVFTNGWSISCTTNGLEFVAP